MPNTAIGMSPAVRETALLTPEAVPTYCISTASITAVVKGVTLTAMPIPKTTAAGTRSLNGKLKFYTLSEISFVSPYNWLVA